MVQKDSLGNESWANETNFSEDDGKLGKTIETDIMDKTNSSIQVKAKRNHTKRLLANIYYSPQSKVSISLRLVQNACRN